MKRKYYRSKSFFSISFEFNKPFKNQIDVVFFKSVQNENEYNKTCIKEHINLIYMRSKDNKEIKIEEIEEYEIVFDEYMRKALLNLTFPIENSCKEKCYLYTYCKNERHFYYKYLTTINEEIKKIQENLKISR